MNLGVTQILLILVVGFLLFGDIPKRVEELKRCIEMVRGKDGEKWSSL